MSSVRATDVNPQVSIQFLRAQGAQVWGSGHFVISSIDNGLSSSENGPHHLLGAIASGFPVLENNKCRAASI